jgi:hypothetical protein
MSHLIFSFDYQIDSCMHWSVDLEVKVRLRESDSEPMKVAASES